MKSRLPRIASKDLSSAQEQILADIVASGRGNLSGPFLAWIHSPELARPAQELGAFCRFATSLAPRLTELAILQTASWWQSQAEWQIHEPIARAAGLGDAVIAALKAGQTPEFELEDERLVFRIGQSIYANRSVNAALYDQGVSCFGTQGMVELVGVLGYYALVSMTLNVFEMRLDVDHP